MERHIGLFKSEGSNAKGIGELIVNGNHIEFYFRGNVTPLKQWFVGKDDEQYYRIFVEGYDEYGSNCSLSGAIPLKVNCVLVRNNEFGDYWRPNEIIGCSFSFPEIVYWLGTTTVETKISDDGTLIASERLIESIVLIDEDPHVEVIFETKGIRNGIDSVTEVSLEKNPRISITYSDIVSIETVTQDMAYIMQFFGLIINHVSDVQDIRLKYLEQESYTYLCENYDFSYNLKHTQLEYSSLTRLEELKDGIKQYFSKWYAFCCNSEYDLIRIMYFTCNKRKDIFAEDVFVYYVRFLEGSYLRESGVEAEIERIREGINKVGKEIRNIILSEENKEYFREVFKSVVPDWKFNSDHVLDIGKSIANNFLKKSDLATCLELYNTDYFDIISINYKYVFQSKELRIEDQKKDYIKRIVNTRNYYSHFKNDKRDILDFTQMCYTINVLKSIITMKLFSVMGMSKEIIRSIIIRDPEIPTQTYEIRSQYIQENKS